jgi:hypothetical protein
VEGRRQLVLTVTRQRSSSSQHRRRFGRTRRDWSGPTAITDPPALRPDLNVPLATHSVFSFSRALPPSLSLSRPAIPHSTVPFSAQIPVEQEGNGGGISSNCHPTLRGLGGELDSCPRLDFFPVPFGDRAEELVAASDFLRFLEAELQTHRIWVRFRGALLHGMPAVGSLRLVARW